MNAATRIAALLRAAHRVRDARDPLGKEARARLPASSGLSPAGVALALEQHLETDAADNDLAALLADAEPASTVHVVLAANVCTAPLRALACALAAAPRVRLRASTRDPVLAELLLRAIDEDPAFEGDLALVDDVAPQPGEALHVYGRDATIALYRERCPSGTWFWAHGTGLGVAAIGEGAALADAARLLAADLVAFDGRGCLSPRVVLVAGDADRPRAFALAAHEELAASPIPRGPLDDEDRAALTRHRQTLTAIGEVFEGEHHLVALDPAPESLALGPALRSTLVLPASARALLPLGQVAALGVQGEGPAIDALARALPQARRSALGRMQRPPLDGPVDRRTRPERVGGRASPDR